MTMKLNRINFVVATVFISLVAVLIPVNARAEAQHGTPETSEWIVPVFLPDIAAIPELNTDKWIDLSDLPASEHPESAYHGFCLPHINAVYTWHKSIIESLTAKCSVILIDYNDATPADILALPINHIVAIGVCGPQARIITTSALTYGGNPALISADLMEFVALAKAAGYHKNKEQSSKTPLL